MLTAAVMSVSYTHLDVYKRQILSKSNSWLNKESIENRIDEEEELTSNINAKKKDDIPKVEECLELMSTLEIVQRRQKNNEFEYCIVLEEKK